MRILNFAVNGVPRAEDRVGPLILNPDLNILTGRNGSGKTTLLKCMWYVISGNIDEAIKEIPFNSIELETDLYHVLINRLNETDVKITLTIDGKTREYEDYYDDDGDFGRSAEAVVNEKLSALSSSVFFPTFRRIEGGFSIPAAPKNSFLTSVRSSSRSGGDLEDALVDLSRKMSNGKHTFVASLSTQDVVGLLLRQYTDMSEASNRLQRVTSDNIISNIKDYKLERADDVGSAEDVLDSIKSMIENLDRETTKIMSPLAAIQILIEKLFQHGGIKLNNRLSFGDAATAVSSDWLSAGEKQMLSFICYNAFVRDSVIFIDEPELSLHVDWQRQLFGILEGQGSSNQFVIATHSPFIYSRYPEKEIQISPDRGDEA